MTKANILIVEDERIVAMDIQASLERADYQVVACADRGEDAINKARELHPDLILMDISLKGEMDGIEVAAQIRANLDIPVIFLTAYANQSTLERARLAEPFGYILKPYEERDLNIAIEMAVYKHSMERKLRESENKFHNVVENASDGIALIDNQGYLIEWNGAMEKITGMHRSDVLGQPVWEIIFQMLPGWKNTAEFREFTTAQWKAELLNGYANKDNMAEYEVESADGAIRIVQSNGFVVETIQGVLGGVIMRDITKSKKAEEELYVALKKYQVLFESFPLGITITDKLGRIIEANHASERLLGISRNEHLERTYDSKEWQIVRTDGSPMPIAEFASVRALQENRLIENVEMGIVKDGGEITWISVNAAPIPLPEYGVAIAYGDITERKKTESEIRKLSHAVEQSASIVIVTDVNGNIEYANPKFTEVSGYSLSEVLGKTPRILRSGEHSLEFYQHLWRTIKSGDIWHGELHNKRKDGQLYWESVTIAPVYDSNGKIVNFIAVKEDITARKLLEDAERDQRQLADALRDTAMALSSTLNLDDVLDRILENIEKLVQCDVAMVSLIEGDVVRNIHYRSLQEKVSNRLSIGDIQANLLNIPILKQIVNTKRSYLIPDIQNDARWKAIAIPGIQRIRSLICVPIEIQERVMGIINIISATPDRFHALHADRIKAFASQAAIAIDNAKLYEKAKHLSTIDPLTDLFNMRYFLDFSQLEFERCHRYERTLSVAMVDIDHFKSVNDSYGHTTGDAVLSEIADRIQKSVRSVDVVARYGGEEFIILMPETNLNEAGWVAERVRQVVNESPMNVNEKNICVTLSVGVAEKSRATMQLDDLIKAADKALYIAKANGRNRVEAYSDN